MPHIWISKFDRQFLKEVEKTIEHIVNESTRGFRERRGEQQTAGYLSSGDLANLADKAKRDVFGRVSMEEVPFKREKFTVVGIEPLEGGGIKVRKRKV